MFSVKKIGIYGGTFDPIHNAHLILARWAIVELKLDLIYFVPASVHAFKKKSDLSPPEIRYKMISAAIANIPELRVSRIELDKSSTSYTIDTLKDIRTHESLGNSQLVYIIGSDNLAEFHLWKDPEDILKIATVSVLRRPGYNEQKIYDMYKDKIKVFNSPLINISSTKIRKRVRENKPYKNLVPHVVYEIIEKNRLYKN